MICNNISILLLSLVAIFLSTSEAVKCFQCAAYVGENGYYYWENGVWVLRSLYKIENVKPGNYYDDFLLPREKSCGKWADPGLKNDYKKTEYGVECEHGCMQLHTTQDLQHLVHNYLFYQKGCWDKKVGKMNSCQVNRFIDPVRNITDADQKANLCVCNEDYCNDAMPQPGMASSAKISKMMTKSTMG